MTKPSARVRQLHRKFGIPTLTMERFWQPDDDNHTSCDWPLNIHADTRTPGQWKKFCQSPFNGEDAYLSYVVELATISATYVDYMQRKNSNGVTALQVLRNGATRQHFECLQNSSRLIARLEPKESLLGVGTTRNEQLHREIKSWMRNIYTAHKDRLQCGLRIFLLAKLLTHSSACYSPTLTQTSQSRLLSILAGNLRKCGFFTLKKETLRNYSLPQTINRNNLHNSYAKAEINITCARREKRKLRKIMW